MVLYSAVKMNSILFETPPGFLVGKTVYGRPADIYRIDANSFYFSDDRAGVVYYVRKKNSS